MKGDGRVEVVGVGGDAGGRHDVQPSVIVITTRQTASTAATRLTSEAAAAAVREVRSVTAHPARSASHPPMLSLLHSQTLRTEDRGLLSILRTPVFR